MKDRIAEIGSLIAFVLLYLLIWMIETIQRVIRPLRIRVLANKFSKSTDIEEKFRIFTKILQLEDIPQ